MAKSLNQSILIAAAITISSASVAAAEFEFSFMNCVQQDNKWAKVFWQMDNGTETHFIVAAFQIDLLASDGTFILDTTFREENLRPGKINRGSRLIAGECSEIAAVEVSPHNLKIKNFGGDDYRYGDDNADAASFRDEFDKTVVVTSYSGINASWIAW